MKKHKPELPLLKEYAAFIQKNFLKEFIQEALVNYKKLDVPLLKLFAHLSEEQLLQVTSKSLNEFLQQFIDGRAGEAAEVAIENWKANKLPGISREDIKASDLVLINNARKTALLKFMHEFIPNTGEAYPLLKELEDYYTYHTGLAIQAFTDIKQDEVIQRENRLREAQSFAKVGNWEYNTVTNEVIWSDELYKIYGMDPSQPLTVNDVVKYIVQEDLHKVQQTVRGAAQSGGTYTIEYRIKSTDGGLRTLLENGYSERNGENQLLYRGTAQDITALKKIENELRENEKNFRLLAENSTDVISRHALDSTILYISPASLPITGYTSEELTGKKAYDFYHPEDLASMEEKYQHVAEIPDSTIVSFRFRKKDGNYIWFESIAKTIRDENGNYVEIIATNRDITARKESELKLRKNEALLTGILNSSISGTQLFKSVKDEQGNIVDFEWLLANDSVLKFWGLTRDAILGKRLLTTFPGVKASGLFDQYVRAAKGEMLTFKHYYNYEGFNHWFAIVAMKYDDGILLSTDDITAQITAEEELKRTNSELEEKVKIRTEQLEKQKEYIYSVLMQAPAMISILKGPDLIFELANPMYLKIVGRSEDVIGKRLLDVFPELKGKPSNDILDKVYKTGERYIGNEVVASIDLKRDGIAKDIYFNIVYEPLKNNEGKIEGILTHAVEVTDQVHVRLKLQQSEENLENKNKELIKINNDLDNFIYTASHDLKSPVSNLEGLLNMVSDDDAGLITDIGKSVLPMVAQSLTRLKTVITELTEIARIQKDIEVEQEMISLDEFYKEVLQSCEPEISNYKGKVTGDFSKAPLIKFSKRNLRSIFFNLLSNALKYSDPDKEGLVQIKTERQDNYLVLTVSDNGLGIPEMQKEKVFTMFKRYHTHVEGSGVGLYIVKRIVENAGGKIELESEEGKGTMFKLYLND